MAVLTKQDSWSRVLPIQFNSIQYRHLYAPANEHHVGAHGEETKLPRKIKYMNDKRKKSINYEKSEISVLFWMSGARVRDHASPPGASSTRQTRRSRTLVDPVSLFWFVGRTEVGPSSWMSACWHDRRKLKPECTDRIGNRELGHGDICRRVGRSYSSPGPPHPTSATADAWPPTQMIGTVVAVPSWRPRGELPVVYQSDNADRKRGARCSNRYACVWVRVPEHEQRPWWGIDGWFAVAGAGISRHPKCGWRASPASSHCRWGHPDLGHSQRVEGQRPTPSFRYCCSGADDGWSPTISAPSSKGWDEVGWNSSKPWRSRCTWTSA